MGIVLKLPTTDSEVMNVLHSRCCKNRSEKLQYFNILKVLYRRWRSWIYWNVMTPYLVSKEHLPPYRREFFRPFDRTMYNQIKISLSLNFMYMMKHVHQDTIGLCGSVWICDVIKELLWARPVDNCIGSVALFVRASQETFDLYEILIYRAHFSAVIVMQMRASTWENFYTIRGEVLLSLYFQLFFLVDTLRSLFQSHFFSKCILTFFIDKSEGN